MYRRLEKKRSMTQERAEEIGLGALVFLAEEPARLGRFLAETGLGPEDLRREAGSPEMLAAVLGHLLSDESMLLVFTSGGSIDPTEVHAARTRLGGDSPWDNM